MEDRCIPLTLSAAPGSLDSAVELLVLMEVVAQVVEVMPVEAAVGAGADVD